MRLAVGVLSLAAIGVVNARPADELPSKIASMARDASKSALRRRVDAGSINPLIPGVLGPFVPNGDLSTLIPIAMPKSLAPRTASQLMSRSPQRTGGKGTGLPKTPKIPSLDQLTNIAKGIIPKDVSKGDQIKCTNQEVSCSFLQKQAFDLQNDDDECLKIATSFDDQGKLDIAPLASSSDTVVYGITTDGLSASAWCNDIGWTLRRIYTKCRRGKVCYGGQGYAARNAAFMVSVGPKSIGPRVVTRWPNIEFYDTAKI